MKTYWRKEGLELAQVTGGGEGKKEERGGGLHSKWRSCTEEVGKGVRRGLSEVIGIGCRCRCFLSFST